MPDHRSATPVRGTLGANQIKWLRLNIPPFDQAWKAVQAADAHAEKVKLRLQDRKRHREELAQNVGR